MCTSITEKAEMSGSAKGPDGWFSLTHAHVYFDHPYHAPLDHALMIDFVSHSAGPATRVAVELSAESARQLIDTIRAALASGEAVSDSGSP